MESYCLGWALNPVMFQSIYPVHLVAQLYLTPCNCDPMDCSPPGSSVQGISQARILQWVAISFSRGSSQPRDRTHVSCIAGGFFTIWATREAKPRDGCLFKGRDVKMQGDKERMVICTWRQRLKLRSWMWRNAKTCTRGQEESGRFILPPLKLSERENLADT